MAKRPQTNTAFHSFKLSPLTHGWCASDVNKSTADLVLDLVEYSEDGTKVSFGRKPDRNGYSVAITIPSNIPGADYECASFWGSDAYEALEMAYIAFVVLDACHKGWAEAQVENDRIEKMVKARLAEMNRRE